MKLVRAPSESSVAARPAPMPEQAQGLGLDKGYHYQEVCAILTAFGFTAHIRSRSEEAQASQPEAGSRARRWVGERVPRWMNRFRRILIRWAQKPAHYSAFLHCAWALIAFRTSGLCG